MVCHPKRPGYRHALKVMNKVMHRPGLRIALPQHVCIALPEVLSLLLKIMFLLDKYAEWKHRVEHSLGHQDAVALATKPGLKNKASKIQLETLSRVQSKADLLTYLLAYCFGKCQLLLHLNHLKQSKITQQCFSVRRQVIYVSCSCPQL